MYLGAERSIQCQPADRSRNVLRAAQNFAVDQDAGANPGAHSQENGVLGAF